MVRMMVWSCLLALLAAPILGDAQERRQLTPEEIEALSQRPMVDPFVALYNDRCALCHGEDLFGAAQGTPLVGIELNHGDSVEAIAKSIGDGFPARGMPGWSATLSADQIWNIALYVAERRAGTDIVDKRADIPLHIPAGTVETDRHAFRIEKIISGLDPLPFSIAPLPDGRILVSEKLRGLSVIAAGKQSPLISGTPRAYADARTAWGQLMGVGWMLDVAIHPNYAANGWVYIQFGDRCSDCNEASRASGRPVSMNKLVRGRIKDGAWVDEETIWQADIESYTDQSDISAGGRIAFDRKGFVYITVGMKGAHEHLGIQDLALPYGKIHRVHDDGRIPADNPYVDVPGALGSIWSIGHRSPQGLEYDAATDTLWSSEMGPRGGDELNLILPGRNYGWPLFTSGVGYDGTPIDYFDELNSKLTAAEVEMPVVDMTPSPAVSSFVVYRGGDFPNWTGHMIVGMLRATDLVRMEIVDNRLVQRETLLEDLARFRDIEVGHNGELYVLLEHANGGQIVRLVPDD